MTFSLTEFINFHEVNVVVTYRVRDRKVSSLMLTYDCASLGLVYTWRKLTGVKLNNN